jgi:hypothetical protein
MPVAGPGCVCSAMGRVSTSGVARVSTVSTVPAACVAVSTEAGNSHQRQAHYADEQTRCIKIHMLCYRARAPYALRTALFRAEQHGKEHENRQRSNRRNEPNRVPVMRYG